MLPPGRADGRGGALSRERRNGTSARSDHGDASVDQLGRQLRQSLHLIVGEAVFDRHVLALDITRILQALAESTERLAERIRRLAVKDPYDRDRHLLRARGKRPRSH